MFIRVPVIIKVLIGFGLAIFGISYFLFNTYQTANENVHDNIVLNYHIHLITSVERLVSDIQTIEAGKHDYILTHEEKFLEPLYKGQKKFIHSFSELKQITMSDEKKRAYVDSLQKMSDRKMQLTESIVSLVKEGKYKDATNFIQNSEEKRLMAGIGEIAGQLEMLSRIELNKINTAKGYTTAETRKNFLILSLLIFIALVSFYFVIVSDLKKSEIVKGELKEASIRIHDLYDNSPAGYISLDKDYKIIKANQTIAQWLGFSVAELENKKNLTDIVNPKYHEELHKQIAIGSTTNFEIEINVNNQSLDVILDCVSVYDANGKVIEKRIAFTDITKRKKAEEENRYLARLIDQTSDAIVSTDLKLTIRSWNKGAEKMYGYTPDEIIGKNVTVLRGKFSEEDQAYIMGELRDRGQWSGEFVHHRKDGSEITVLTSASAYRDEHGNVTGFISVIQDVTHRILYEQKLRNFNNELIEKVNIKTNEIVNILERVTDGFLSLDREFRVTYLNNIAAKMLGVEKSFILGKDLRETFAKEDNNFRKAYMRAFETQTRVEIEDYYPFLDKWFYCVGYPSPEGISIFFRDITKRKESEVKLVETEKQYRHLFENNPLPMWVLDVSSMSILDVNKAAIKNYGFSYLEFIGKKMAELIAPEDKQRFDDLQELRKFNVENSGVWKHRTKDGNVIQVEILSYDTKYTERPSLLIISNDITEKIKYEEDLKESRDQLRQLSIHSEKVREEERAHIAREIHDELGQQLTGIKMDLSWLFKRIDTSSPGVKEKITEMLNLVDDTVKSIRKIASELRPGMLDDLGLNAAIGWQTHEFEKRSGISCIYNSNLKEQNFDKNISIGVFRILQEALTNVARHSKATRVDCDLTTDNNELRLTINDNGMGIVKTQTKQRTLGLLGMKERALMMHGHLTIDSKPGGGTKVNLIVPLNATLN